MHVSRVNNLGRTPCSDWLITWGGAVEHATFIFNTTTISWVRHDLLDLPTNKQESLKAWKLITCCNVILIPFTPAIIKQVHLLAIQDSQPYRRKITKITSQVPYNSAWNAGVDYDKEKFYDSDQSDLEGSSGSNKGNDGDYQYHKMDHNKIENLDNPPNYEQYSEDNKSNPSHAEDDGVEECIEWKYQKSRLCWATPAGN